MEMTKVDENIQTAQNLLSGIVERCYELEEENKKLNEYNRRLKQCNDDLKEQNKKLKEIIRKNVNGCPYGGLYCGQYLGL